MKYTSVMLMRDMGLQVGDRVKYKTSVVEGFVCVPEEHIVEVVEDDSGIIWLQTRFGHQKSITNLLNVDFEILPRPKRVGDLKCDGKCTNCKVKYICDSEINAVDRTLYEVLEQYKLISKDYDYFDQEIYDLLKARLDKEVK